MSEDLRKPRLIDRDDAFLIFDKWRTEGTLLRCFGSFLGWSLYFDGTVVAASDTEVKFSDSNGEVSLRILLRTADIAFMYGELGAADFPSPEDAREISGLTIGLPFRLTPTQAGELIGRQDIRVEEVPQREKLTFVEVPR